MSSLHSSGLLSHIRDRCVSDYPLLLSLILTNAAIAGAYLSIPYRLQRIRRRVGGHITKYREVKLIAMFVASCGVTHVLSIAVLFLPILDWPAILWSIWTAIISWYTESIIRHGEDFYVASILEARELLNRIDNSERVST